MCESNNSLMPDTGFMSDCYLSVNQHKIIDARIAYSPMKIMLNFRI